MAKFVVPSFPQSRASLWQIMILWQFGRHNKLYVPAILGPWVQGLFGVYSSYIPWCGIKSSVYGQVRGVLVPTNEGVPVADNDSMVVWTMYCMYQPYWVRGSKGYLVHITHIPDLLWNQNCAYGLVWDAVVPTNEGVPVADYDLMAVWTLYCMYQPYWVCGSKGYLVHIAHIPFAAVELIEAYMAKFGVPSFQQTRASLWQIMILWQFGPCTVCTSHIGSVGPRAIWYTQLIYPRCGMKNRVYGQVWGALVPTVGGVLVAG